MQRDHSPQGCAGTREFEDTATSKTVPDCRDPICIAFGATLKCPKTGKEPLAKVQSIFEKGRHNLLRQLRRPRANARSE